eukprot:Gregarina_sp_Poly_1__3740@NODE_2107_length_2677_cov_74_206130_g614_i1_p3_GENE_NODE_2107_length_2677_cov_74_206130_g614_i1NODE_2107_length_2677_cov_74_206130_g614_i1_p3_ORF_typecomplete_len183_score20_96Rhodanese_C/PF12368_8/0_11_NODE_2107_length_2677_cov_74_206130_g614_i110461594
MLDYDFRLWDTWCFPTKRTSSHHDNQKRQIIVLLWDRNGRTEKPEAAIVMDSRGQLKGIQFKAYTTATKPSICGKCDVCNLPWEPVHVHANFDSYKEELVVMSTIRKGPFTIGELTRQKANDEYLAFAGLYVGGLQFVKELFLDTSFYWPIMMECLGLDPKTSFEELAEAIQKKRDRQFVYA